MAVGGTWYGDENPPVGARMATPELTDYLGRALDDLDVPPNTVSLGPLVLPRARYAELFDAARGMLRLLRRALLDRAPDHAGRLAALGATEADYPLVVPGPLEDAYATCMARPDLAVDATGPKFLEFNIGSGMGGVVVTSAQTAAWKTAYGGADVAPFTGPDPLAVRDQVFVRAVRELRTPPAVVVVGTLREFPAARTDRVFRLQEQSLRRHGLLAEYVEPEGLLDGLGPTGGRGGPRYRLGLRHFTVFDWTRLGIDLSPVRAALDAGCLLIATQTAYLVANKKVLGWVSEGLPWMTADDRALVDRYLPWTRTVGDRDVTWHGATRHLPGLLLDRQPDFVLKPGLGLGSHGVLLGRSTAPDVWRDAVEEAVRGGDHVVQEYVESVPCRVELSDPDGGGSHLGEVYPVLSPFLFDGRAGGCLVRYLPPGREGVTTVQGNGALVSVALPGR